MTAKPVPCKICGQPTSVTGLTHLCNSCWEVDRHVVNSNKLTTVYKSLYLNAPETWRFESPTGICGGYHFTDEYNTQVVHIVILAHILKIKIQAARIGTQQWEDVDGVPGDFKYFQFRKAQ